METDDINNKDTFLECSFFHPIVKQRDLKHYTLQHTNKIKCNRMKEKERNGKIKKKKITSKNDNDMWNMYVQRMTLFAFNRRNVFCFFSHFIFFALPFLFLYIFCCCSISLCCICEKMFFFGLSSIHSMMTILRFVSIFFIFWHWVFSSWYTYILLTLWTSELKKHKMRKTLSSRRHLKHSMIVSCCLFECILFILSGFTKKKAKKKPKRE